MTDHFHSANPPPVPRFLTTFTPVQTLITLSCLGRDAMNPKQVAVEATQRMTNERPPVERGTGGAGPVSRPGDGAPTNYTNYAQSRISAPDGFQKWFLQQDDMSEALCEFAVAVVTRWNELEQTAMHPDEWTTQDWHNLHLALAFRYVQGATGEIYWANEIDAELAPERDDDETRGIDLRTTDGETYQIKTTRNWGDEQFKNHEANWEVTVKVDEEGNPVEHKKE